jgi:hypothetical protein
MNQESTKFCLRCSEPTDLPPWRGGKTFCQPCVDFLRDEFGGYRNGALQKLRAAGLAVVLAASSVGCLANVGPAEETDSGVASEPDAGTDDACVPWPDGDTTHDGGCVHFWF